MIEKVSIRLLEFIALGILIVFITMLSIANIYAEEMSSKLDPPMDKEIYSLTTILLIITLMFPTTLLLIDGIKGTELELLTQSKVGKS